MSEKQMPYLATMNFYDNGKAGVLGVCALTLGIDTVFEMKPSYVVDSERNIKIEDVILTILNAETNELITQVPFLPALQALGAKVIAGNDEVELWLLEAQTEEQVVEKLELK